MIMYSLFISWSLFILCVIIIEMSILRQNTNKFLSWWDFWYINYLVQIIIIYLRLASNKIVLCQQPSLVLVANGWSFWKFFLFCMCILTNNCALLCVFVHLWFVQKEATNTLMIKTSSFVQYSSAIFCMSLWTIFLHYHHQWSYCFDMVVNTQFCGIFYCFYSVSYTSMSYGQKFIANMFIFTFISSTIVSMSIKITNNYDCLLPVLEWNNDLPKNNLQMFLHNFRQGSIDLFINSSQEIRISWIIIDIIEQSKRD